MLRLFERVSDDISNVTKICGCTDHTDHFILQFSKYTLCTDTKSTCDKTLPFRHLCKYIQCMSTNTLIIPNVYGDNSPRLSFHAKCNIGVINDAYNQLMCDETKKIYNKIRLIFRDNKFHDIIRHTALMFLMFLRRAQC
jgi:hypothetical protein